MDDLLRRAAEPLLTLPYEAWHFGDSVAFEALIVAADALHDESYIRFAQGFARGWAAARPAFEHFDMTAPGAALCEISRRTSDRLLADQLVRLAENLAARRTIEGVFETFPAAPLREGHRLEPVAEWEAELLEDPGAGVFLDCLHFDPPFFASLGRLVGSERWSVLALAQAEGYVRLLQDPETGLFHHFYLERTGRAHILGWGRGQGWALLGLLEVIEVLGRSERTATIEASAVALVRAMLATQRADGHWDAVVGRPEGGIETSTAAFMVAGFTRAVAVGLIDEAAVRPAVDAACAAMVGDMDDDGILNGVSIAVWASTSVTHYDNVPRGFLVPWGQGPAVLALGAVRGRE